MSKITYRYGSGTIPNITVTAPRLRPSYDSWVYDRYQVNTGFNEPWLSQRQAQNEPRYYPDPDRVDIDPIKEKPKQFDPLPAENDPDSETPDEKKRLKDNRAGRTSRAGALLRKIRLPGIGSVQDVDDLIDVEPQEDQFSGDALITLPDGRTMWVPEGIPVKVNNPDGSFTTIRAQPGELEIKVTTPWEKFKGPAFVEVPQGSPSWTYTGAANVGQDYSAMWNSQTDWARVHELQRDANIWQQKSLQERMAELGLSITEFYDHLLRTGQYSDAQKLLMWANSAYFPNRLPHLGINWSFTGNAFNNLRHPRSPGRDVGYAIWNAPGVASWRLPDPKTWKWDRIAQPPEIGINIRTGTRANPYISLHARQVNKAREAKLGVRAQQNRNTRQDNTRRQDKKSALTKSYLSFLWFVNKTWGTVTEARDHYDALRFNITVYYGGTWRPLASLPASEQKKLMLLIATGQYDGRYEFDQWQYIKDVVFMEATDQAIGLSKQWERDALNDMGYLLNGPNASTISGWATPGG